MKKISITSLLMAFIGLITPYGFEAVVIFASVASALSLKDRPVVSAFAFVINFFNILAHVPGLAFQPDAFEAGILSLGGPLHWGYLAIQLPVIFIGFMMMASVNAPRIAQHRIYKDGN